MKSLSQKVAQLEGLIDTRDVSAWENDFLRSITRRVAADGGTAALSEKQISIIERIHEKHFA